MKLLASEMTRLEKPTAEVLCKMAIEAGIDISEDNRKIISNSILPLLKRCAGRMGSEPVKLFTRVGRDEIFEVEFPALTEYEIAFARASTVSKMEEFENDISTVEQMEEFKNNVLRHIKFEGGE